MKGSWEKESTFMKSWVSLSVVVVIVVLSIGTRERGVCERVYIEKRVC